MSVRLGIGGLRNAYCVMRDVQNYRQGPILDCASSFRLTPLSSNPTKSCDIHLILLSEGLLLKGDQSFDVERERFDDAYGSFLKGKVVQSKLRLPIPLQSQQEPAKAARYFRRRPERECSPPPPQSNRPTTFRMRSSSSSNSIPRWSMRSRSFQTRRRGFSDPDFDPTILLILSRLWLGDLFGVIIKAIQFFPQPSPPQPANHQPITPSPSRAPWRPPVETALVPPPPAP